MAANNPWYSSAQPGVAIAVAVGAVIVLYLGLISLCAFFPSIQRNMVYAHRVNDLLWSSLDNPQKWGFAHNQITPFLLDVPSSKSKVYAWHVMPLDVYSRHQDAILKQPPLCSDDFSETEAFRIIKAEPESRVVISFHGNAGHVAQGVRPPHYHSVAALPSTHLLTIDYRGFGRSSGTPTEDGLIADATALVDFVLQVLEIAPSRVVLIGHSLGTAVTAAISERYTRQEIHFAGVVLVAGFSSLPTMLSGYAIAGWLPVLAPLRPCPPLLRMFMGFVVDKWQSADRLNEMVRRVLQQGGRLHLHLIHAVNDWDIPCLESDKLFAAAVRGAVEVDDEALAELKNELKVTNGKGFVACYAKDAVKIKEELITHGGHNDTLTYAPVNLALAQAFISSQRAEAENPLL